MTLQLNLMPVEECSFTLSICSKNRNWSDMKTVVEDDNWTEVNIYIGLNLKNIRDTKYDKLSCRITIH